MDDTRSPSDFEMDEWVAEEQKITMPEFFSLYGLLDVFLLTAVMFFALFSHENDYSFLTSTGNPYEIRHVLDRKEYRQNDESNHVGRSSSTATSHDYHHAPVSFPKVRRNPKK